MVIDPVMLATMDANECRAEIERLRTDLETAERALDAQTDFRAEIERLQEELAATQDAMGFQIAEQVKEIERLKQELERAKRDCVERFPEITTDPDA